MTAPTLTHRTLSCPRCSHGLRIRYEYLGEMLGCKHCGNPFTAKVHVACPGCRRDVTAPPQWFGEKVICPFCERPFRMKFTVACPGCRRGLKLRLAHVGERVICNHCDHHFLVAAPPGQRERLKPYQQAVLLADLFRQQGQEAADSAAGATTPELPLPAELLDGRATVAASVAVVSPALAGAASQPSASQPAESGRERDTTLERLTQEAEAARAERDELLGQYRSAVEESEALRARGAALETTLAKAGAAHRAALVEAARADWEAQARTDNINLRREAEAKIGAAERRLAEVRSRAEEERRAHESRLEELAREREQLGEAAARLRDDAHGLRRGLGRAAGQGQAWAALASRLIQSGARRERELSEARRGLEEATRSCTELAARAEGLDGELRSERARAAAVAAELAAARREAESQRGLAGRAWLLLEKERHAAERARAALERSRDHADALEGDLAAARARFAARVAGLEDELIARGEVATALERELAAARADCQRERAVSRELACRVADQEARLAEIQTRYQELVAEERDRSERERAALEGGAARLQANLDHLRNTLAALTAERDGLTAERDAERAAAEGARHELDLARRDAEAERQTWEAQTAALAGERDRLLEAAGRLRDDAAELRLGLERTTARARRGAARRRASAVRAAAEEGRLGRELDEARCRLEMAERSRQELTERVAGLENELHAERGRVATLAAERSAARGESAEQRGLAGRTWLLLEKERHAGERAREQIAALEGDLIEARRALAAATAGRDALRARLEETEARLDRLERESAAAQARHEAALGEAQREQATLVGQQEALTQRAEALLADLGRAQRAAAESETAAQDSRHALAAALQAGQAQRRRADELERELTAERGRARGRPAASHSLEQEKQALAAEVARLRAAQPGDRLSADSESKATFWERVGSGQLALDPAWLALPVPPMPAAASGGGKRATAPEHLLREVGGDRPPSTEAVQALLNRLGPAGAKAALNAAVKGDAATRRGAGRVCLWLANKARAVGAMEQARVASEEAVRLFAQLAAEAAADHTVRAELLVVRLTHARCERRAGRPREALDTLLAARADARVLVAQQPGVPAYRRLLARSLHDLGAVLYRAGRHAPAEGVLRAAVLQQSELVRRLPQAKNYATELEQMKSALERCLSGETTLRPRTTETIHS